MIFDKVLETSLHMSSMLMMFSIDCSLWMLEVLKTHIFITKKIQLLQTSHNLKCTTAILLLVLHYPRFYNSRNSSNKPCFAHYSS